MATAAREDFALLDLQDLNEPMSFFNKAIRTKYYRRVQREAGFIKHCGRFEVVSTVEEQYDFYVKAFDQLREIHEVVDQELFCKLKERVNIIRPAVLKEVVGGCEAQRNRLETMIGDFKTLESTLVDLYDRALLYGLAEPLGPCRPRRFDVRCDSVKDLFVPFFLSKLFKTFGSVSSTFIHRFFLAIVAHSLKFNIGVLAGLVPAFNAMGSSALVSRLVEKLLFSRTFKQQYEQLVFLFVRLNAMMAEHVDQLDRCLATLFSKPQALGLGEYETIREVVSAKFGDIRQLKFPDQDGSSIGVKELCGFSAIDLPEEAHRLRQEEAELLIEEEDILEPGFGSLGLAKTQRRPEIDEDPSISPFQSTKAPASKQSLRTEVFVNGFLLVDN